MTDRPLWRVGTKTLAAELKRRGDAEAVQRAFLSECDLTLLLAEVARRDLSDQILLAACEQRGWIVYQDRPRMRIAALREGDVPMPRDSTALYDAQAQRWVGPLTKRWPPLADDD